MPVSVKVSIVSVTTDASPEASTLNRSPFGTSAYTPSRTATCSRDRKSTRLNSSHVEISYAVFCLKTKNRVLMAVDVVTPVLSSLDCRHAIHAQPGDVAGAAVLHQRSGVAPEIYGPLLPLLQVNPP